LVMELPVYFEHRGPTSTSIDTVIDLHSERGEQKHRIVLADVFTKISSLWG